jgi:hypothetical protein
MREVGKTHIRYGSVAVEIKFSESCVKGKLRQPNVTVHTHI